MQLQQESAALNETNQNENEWIYRYRFWIVGCTPLLAQLIGSAFNIWYNLSHIRPLLTPAQHAVFINTVLVYNVVVYPVAVYLWVRILRSLHRPCQRLLHRQPIALTQLTQARRLAINLPWWGILVAGVSWLLCIPVFLMALQLAPGQLDARLFLHLPTSILVAALIALTHSFFTIELTSQWLLYPVLFQETQPATTPGAFPLTLRGRGLMWAISAGICPIASLLLLILASQPLGAPLPWFSLSVGGLGIVFGLTTAWMVGQLVVEPVEALETAAQAIAAGNLNTRITLLRADEFGPLIAEFNQMVQELQDKQLLQETFGRHVGEQVAQQILRRDPSLLGVEQEITVLFADIRNFTARCTLSTPQQIVTMLNLFLTEMVEIVEQQHGGIVNKFLGDGFMALFGVGADPSHHAARAVTAGQDMLWRLERINQHLQAQNQPPLNIGIGIHTGPAIVGSIGSPQRLEYTAIGDTVNIASRIESLTKVVEVPLLLTAATRQALPMTFLTQPLPPQSVKGQPHPIQIYGLVAPPAIATHS